MNNFIEKRIEKLEHQINILKKIPLFSKELEDFYQSDLKNDIDAKNLLKEIVYFRSTGFKILKTLNKNSIEDNLKVVEEKEYCILKSIKIEGLTLNYKEDKRDLSNSLFFSIEKKIKNVFIRIEKDGFFIEKDGKSFYFMVGSKYIYKESEGNKEKFFYNKKYYILRHKDKLNINDLNEGDVVKHDLIFNQDNEPLVSYQDVKINNLIYSFINVDSLDFLKDTKKFDMLYWSIFLRKYTKNKDNEKISFKEKNEIVQNNYLKIKEKLLINDIKTNKISNIACFHSGSLLDITKTIEELRIENEFV